MSDVTDKTPGWSIALRKVHSKLIRAKKRELFLGLFRIRIEKLFLKLFFRLSIGRKMMHTYSRLFILDCRKIGIKGALCFYNLVEKFANHWLNLTKK